MKNTLFNIFRRFGQKILQEGFDQAAQGYDEMDSFQKMTQPFDVRQNFTDILAKHILDNADEPDGDYIDFGYDIIVPKFVFKYLKTHCDEEDLKIVDNEHKLMSPRRDWYLGTVSVSEDAEGKNYISFEVGSRDDYFIFNSNLLDDKTFLNLILGLQDEVRCFNLSRDEIEEYLKPFESMNEGFDQAAEDYSQSNQNYNEFAIGSIFGSLYKCVNDYLEKEELKTFVYSKPDEFRRYEQWCEETDEETAEEILQDEKVLALLQYDNGNEVHIYDIKEVKDKGLGGFYDVSYIELEDGRDFYVASEYALERYWEDEGGDRLKEIWCNGSQVKEGIDKGYLPLDFEEVWPFDWSDRDCEEDWQSCHDGDGEYLKEWIHKHRKSVDIDELELTDEGIQDIIDEWCDDNDAEEPEDEEERQRIIDEWREEHRDDDDFIDEWRDDHGELPDSIYDVDPDDYDAMDEVREEARNLWEETAQYSEPNWDNMAKVMYKNLGVDVVVEDLAKEDGEGPSYDINGTVYYVMRCN